MESRVIGHHVDLSGPARALSGGNLAQRFAHTGLDSVVDFAVVEPHSQVEAALPRRRHSPPTEQLERDVPQPRRVMAVGRPCVDGDDDRRRGRREHVEDLRPAGRVLCQQEPGFHATDVDGCVPSGDLTHIGHRLQRRRHIPP